MFDVTTARQVQYKDAYGNDLQVTVFQDRTTKSLWYMVPVPRLRIQSGQPVFNLTKYTSNGGGVAGVCNFETELFAPPEAKQAAEAQIPEISSWGEFTWVSGNASFNYDLTEDGVPTAQEIIVTPSLFDTNAARFQVELETDAALNTFIEAFTGEGNLSAFSVTYSMGVVTQLLGAKATIKYKASAAINYERTYKKTKDTWGNEKQVLTSVKQNLKTSGAGDVKVEKGLGGTNELVQMVRDWAWSSLETQVAQAIDSALKMAQGNENPISVLSDIDITYAEDAIIEWNTPVAHQLPRFDRQTWAKLYHEVDNRQLVIVFELVGLPENEDKKIAFKDVEVTVDYPTRMTGNSFKMALNDGELSSSMTYMAPGTDPYNSTFKYKYTVNYDDAPAYTSSWIESSETRIQFTPARLGIRNVTFTGSDIPFINDDKGSVKKVFIDFFEKPPAGQPSKSQTKEMTSNATDVVFASTYNVPVTNTYRFRLRYQLENNNIITIQPEAVIGTANADRVFVLDPKEHLTSFDLRALHMKDASGFISIDINAVYEDAQNSGQSNLVSHDWIGWTPDFDPDKTALKTADPWIFAAQPDPATAAFKIGGLVLYGDGESQTIQDVHIPYAQKPLILNDTKEIYSVEIFSTQVDWKLVDFVTLNFFQKKPAANGNLAELLECSALQAAVRDELPSMAEANRSVENIARYSILPPPAAPREPLQRYYTLYRLRSAPELEFFFNAEYVMKDGTTKSIGETTVTDKLQIHLPETATEPSGKIHHQSLVLTCS